MATLKAAGRKVTLVDVAALEPHPDNPREEITPESVAELRASVRRHGFTQPLLVRTMGDIARQVLTGMRRLKVAQLEGMKKVPCFVEEMSDEDAIEIVLVDNLHRVDVDPMRESDAVARLLKRDGWTVQDAADALGKSVRWVALRRSLRDLIPELQQLIGDERFATWPIRWWERVSSLSTTTQTEFARDQWLLARVNGRAALDRLMAESSRRLAEAPWDLDDETLNAKQGACSSCTEHSARQPGLFDDGDAPTDLRKATCLLPECFKTKLNAHAADTIQAAVKKAGSAVVFIVTTKDHDLTGWQHPWKQRFTPLAPHTWERVKKGAPGAQVAINVSPTALGKRSYVRLLDSAKKSAESAATDTAKAKAKDDRAPSEILALGQERILDRRRGFMVGRLEKDVRDLEEVKWETVLQLALAYGIANTRHTIRERRQAAKVATGASRLDEFATAAWPRIRPAVLQALTWSSHTKETAWENARFLSDALDLPLAEADAKTEIPDPKGWAKLREQIAAGDRSANERAAAKAAAVVAKGPDRKTPAKPAKKSSRRKPAEPAKKATKRTTPAKKAAKSSTKKKPRANPWAGLTEEQRLERINAIREKRGLPPKASLDGGPVVPKKQWDDMTPEERRDEIARRNAERASPAPTKK